MRNQANKGFTLIELLIVIAIIGILAAVLIPNLLAARNRANDSAALAWTRECVTAVEVNRNNLTGAITLTDGSACAAAIGKQLPAAIETDGAINLTNGNLDFTITGVVSRGGGTFGYDGTELTQ